jgi:hypothetical protein
LRYVLAAALVAVFRALLVVIIPIAIAVTLFRDKTPKIERMIQDQLTKFDRNTKDLDFDATAERTTLNIELVSIGLQFKANVLEKLIRSLISMKINDE